MIFAQIFDMLSVGIVILKKDLEVYKWNRWMETHSRIPAAEIIGSSLFDFFPNLDNPSFLRNFKSVLTFGNYSFLSQKLHEYLFPFKPVDSMGADFEYMQQSCTMAPLRDENNKITFVLIMVHDVTNIALYEKRLIEMNIRDSLTGAFNRRYMETRLAEELARYKRYGRPFSLILQDIDFFKKVNDTHGHQAGDYILKSFASLVASNIRKVDTFIRHGGEEFCCLLPETTIESAGRFAELIRQTIESTTFSFNGVEIPITVSQGVSELTQDTTSMEELLEKADDALYRAKETGRNKVVKMGWEKGDKPETRETASE